MYYFSVFFFEAPVKTIFPHHQVMYVGDTIKFTCFSYRGVIWIFNGDSLPLNAVTYKLENHNVLIINNSQLINAGIYTCYGFEENGHSFKAVGTLTLRGKSTCFIISIFYETIHFIKV